VGREIVLNDVLLDSSSGVLVLTGPNRGGKTTYTRGIGLAQLLAQAGLGCPASAARISPVDRLITHFPRAESGQLEAGRLGEEASRIAAIFEVLTRHSLVLLNESLSCTSPGESLYLAEDVVRALRLAGCRAVFTTHLHELAARAGAINSETPGESAVVSMVAGIQMPDAGDPSAGEPTAAEAKRTFRIEPAPPAGRSFARDVARRHGISLQLLEAKLRERRVL
jgi:DNA mismatch repair ATPase MutS